MWEKVNEEIYVTEVIYLLLSVILKGLINNEVQITRYNFQFNVLVLKF